VTDVDDPTALMREVDDIIVKLRLRELNPGEAGRWLQRVADRLNSRPEPQTRLRSAATHLLSAEEELQQVRESLAGAK
jgi:hypothetical protein